MSEHSGVSYPTSDLSPGEINSSKPLGEHLASLLRLGREENMVPVAFADLILQDEPRGEGVTDRSEELWAHAAIVSQWDSQTRRSIRTFEDLCQAYAFIKSLAHLKGQEGMADVDLIMPSPSDDSSSHQREVISPNSSGNILPSHRIILASRIPYFRARLFHAQVFPPQEAINGTDKDNSSSKPQLTWPTLITRKTADIIIDWTYTDEVRKCMSMNEVIEVWRAADYMLIEPLATLLLDWMIGPGIHRRQCHCHRCIDTNIPPLLSLTAFPSLPSLDPVRRVMERWFRINWPFLLGKKSFGSLKPRVRNAWLGFLVDIARDPKDPESVLAWVLGRGMTEEDLGDHSLRPWAREVRDVLNKWDDQVQAAFLNNLGRIMKSSLWNRDRPISIGDRVSWGPVGEVKEGNVAFVGPVHFQQGIWVGVQVDEPGQGKNDGSIQGVRYFYTPSPKQGVFIKYRMCHRVR
ncbi:MAG: hypothetical protein DHS80DRAFT_33319 [Piptocephalis tieghemiana]|nr:MAG: hypothetical protein DHS80DRAFT_33319 [Piptocephalis tieghemiana]